MILLLILLIFIALWLSRNLSSDFLRGRTTVTIIMDHPAEFMNCILRVDTRFLGWHVMLVRVLKSMDGITYKIDGEKGTVQITGRLNPKQLMKTLAEVGLHADLSPMDSGCQEMDIPSRHPHDYWYHGSYGYNPYGRPEYYPDPYGRPNYYHGYLPPPHYHNHQRNWHHISENYPHYLHYYQHQHYPRNEPPAPAQYFPQPPPQPVGFRNGDPEWCIIM